MTGSSMSPVALFLQADIVVKAVMVLLIVASIWTWTIIPVYIVWDRATRGAAWRVPNWLMVVEYGLVVGTIILLWITDRQRQAERHPASVPAVDEGTPS